LLNAFGDLDTLFAQLASVAELSIRGSQRIMQLLERHQDDVRLARRLTEIKTDVPLTVHDAELRPGRASAQALDEFLTELGFGARLRKQALPLVLEP
jgi:DNA polymerase-1